MQKREFYIVAAVAVVIAAFAIVSGVGAGFLVMYQKLQTQQEQLAQIEIKLDRLQPVGIFNPQIHAPSFQSFPMAPIRPRQFLPSQARTAAAAPESLEGQIVAQGKEWVRVPAEIVPGAYVEDVLQGRFGQPPGRGTIGKVLSVDTSDIGHETAVVDFGRGYTTGINFSELSVVTVVSKKQ